MAVEQLITQHLDLWTAAIKRRSAAGRGSSSKIELYGIKKLRELILGTALRGLIDVQKSSLPESIEQDIRKAKVSYFNKIGKKPKDYDFGPSLLTEFELPTGWAWKRVGHLCDLRTGATPNTQNHEFFGGSIRWLVSGDINQEVIEDCEGRITEKGLANSNCKVLPPKTVLIALNGQGKTRASVALLNVPAACNQSLVGMIPFDPKILDSEFLLLSLKYRYYEIRDITGQNQRRGLNMGLVSELSIPLPPISVQHSIVAKVNELMALCDQLEQQTDASLSAHQTLVETLLNTLISAADHAQFASSWQRIAEHFDTVFTTEESIDQLKQTILQLAVMGKLVPQDPKDEPASELLKKIAVEKARLVKEGKIKTHLPVEPTGNPQVLPATWVEIVVQDFADIRLGSTPSRTEPKFWNGDIPWVSSGEVANCTIRDTSEKITQEGFNNSSTSMIPARSLLMAIIGQGKTRGQTALLEIDACTNQNVAAFVFDERFVCAEYVWTWAKSKYESHRDDGRGGAQPALNGKIVRSFRFPLAPIAEQCRIVAKVDELMALCDQLKARLSDSQATQLNLAEALTEAALAEA